MIAVISDTHLPRGRRRLPAACVRYLRDADLIVHAGDFTASSALEELTGFGRVAAVHGNMDDAGLRRLLPERREVEAGGRRIGIVHDAGRRDGRSGRLQAWFPGCDVIVYGHSHVPEITREGSTWILNPGSPTERRRSPMQTMIVLEETGPALVEL